MNTTTLSVCLSLALVGCSAGSTTAPDTTAPADRATIVVTYSVLGAVVSELVGDTAEVSVVIPDGQDPHDFEPSAKDIETINEADLIVSNGLGFEEGLVDAIEVAHDRGVDHFSVSDHVTTREGKSDDHGDEHGDEHGAEQGDAHADEHGDAHADEQGHDHAVDPHLWLSPMVMSEMVDDLAAAITAATGIDLSASATALNDSLVALDELVASRISSLESCTLVTGHDELGYFADRYGCDVIGAVIPSFSTSAEASAGELATLKELVETNGVPTIFTGLGTSSDVVDRLVAELGVRAVELTTHFMDGVQTYDDFMQRLTDQIVTGLS